MTMIDRMVMELNLDLLIGMKKNMFIPVVDISVIGQNSKEICLLHLVEKEVNQEPGQKEKGKTPKNILLKVILPAEDQLLVNLDHRDQVEITLKVKVNGLIFLVIPLIGEIAITPFLRYIVSDCDSVGVFYNTQHYTSTPEEAAAIAIKAATKGFLNEADVNSVLANTLTVQMRLGMFDGEPSAQPFGNLGPKDVCTPAHQQLALEAARQGIVLLENSSPSLPLSHLRHRTVAVIGPNSNATVTMIGNYAGVACGYTSPFQGVGNYTKTIHQMGCVDIACADDKLFSEAIDAARQADATVLVMGLDQSMEAEFKDRTGLLLPGRQQELVSKVAMASNGPTILVLMPGGPIDVSFANNDPRIGAILWSGYPGQAGGAAIANVLYGTTNPEGKLPMTWYPQGYVSNMLMKDMAMRSRPNRNYPGRTYRFYKGPVVYPFGHGLSYTNFVHTIASVPTFVSVPLGGHHHSGNDGTRTMLVFSTPPVGHWAPHKQLVAFAKVHVPAGSQQRMGISFHVCKFLSVVDRSGVRRVPIGIHDLHIGSVKHSLSLQAATLGVIKT
ncbi:Beta-D-xylosidase 1 [Hibiscus syriacus]|uniref:Beta-D-xylosidase 1 n=1 Tax=Hibiscus syriacus TaxID=106335 RepID=A0A6A2YIT1_HIBSY|nr:Beta-D-xylosidase 1 [Hibiscus syriacus]